MREILFRGKRVDNGEWETGSLVISRMGTSESKFYIADKMTAYHTPVIPETVGQYVLPDKNGKRIFEGDIVKHYGKSLVGDPVGDIGVVTWDCDEFFFFRTSLSGKDKTISCHDTLEVLGNIYDNPELLNK